MYQQNNLLAQLLRPLLEKEDIWELFGEVRRALLTTQFEGLNIKELWLASATEKEDSIFIYREMAL